MHDADAWTLAIIGMQEAKGGGARQAFAPTSQSTSGAIESREAGTVRPFCNRSLLVPPTLDWYPKFSK